MYVWKVGRGREIPAKWQPDFPLDEYMLINDVLLTKENITLTELQNLPVETYRKVARILTQFAKGQEAKHKADEADREAKLATARSKSKR